MQNLVIGDDFSIIATLQSGQHLQAEDISSATSVKVAIISTDYKTKYVTEVTSESGDAGASWSSGKIAINFTAAQTAVLADYFTTEGFARLEIEVTMNAKTHTWNRDGSLIRVLPGKI